MLSAVGRRLPAGAGADENGGGVSVATGAHLRACAPTLSAAVISKSGIKDE